MSSTLAILTEKALRIPSKNIREDVDTLRQLLIYGKNYFDFCFSRFQLLSDNREALDEIKGYILSEHDKEYYLPFLGILLQKLESKEISEFLYQLLTSLKAPSVLSYVLINQNTNIFIKDLCTLLFNNIPETSLIMIRDDVLFRFLGLGGSVDFAITCLAKIPTNEGYDFAQEFILIFTYLAQTCGCTSSKLLNVVIDVTIKSEDPYTLIDLILGSEFMIPQAFADWIQQNISSPPAIPADRIKQVPLKDLPALLRIQLLRPAPSAMNTQRLCRAIKQSGGLYGEFVDRVLHEQDPVLLHDLLVSKPAAIKLMKNIPIKFTLLALAAVNNPNLTPTFLGEFCSVKKGESDDIVTAACAGLALLSERNPGCVAQVFPHVRILLQTYCAGYDYLMKAIENAVKAEALHSGFIWRDYKNLLTVTENEISSDRDMIHQCLIALHDPKYSERAEDILLEIARTDKPSIEKAVLQIQPEILINHQGLYYLRPTVFQAPNPKTDVLPLYLTNEMKKEMTTQRILWIATAFGAFPDAFKDFDVPVWALPIVQAGKDAFNMKLSLDVKELQKKFNAKETKDEQIRFGAMFALCILMSYKLVDSLTFTPKLVSVSTTDPAPIVRLISLYGLSKCRVVDPMNTIKNVINNKKSTSEDLVGVAYCLTNWVTQFPDLFTNLKVLNDIPFFWSHVAEAAKFVLKPYVVQTGDLLGLAEYIHLTSLEDKTEEYIDLIVEKGVTPEIFAAALFGFIPSLAFSSTPFDMSERFRKIFTNAKGDEYDLLKTFITRPKMPQKAPEQKKESQTSVNMIRQNYNELSEQDFSFVVTGLSKGLCSMLMEENGPHSLVLAAHLKNTIQAGRLLALKKWDRDIMLKVSAKFNDSKEDVVIQILNNSKDPSNAASFLAYAIFGEQISDDAAVLMLPWMVTQLDVSLELLNALIKANAQMKEISHAVILTAPNVFTAEGTLYSLFE